MFKTHNARFSTFMRTLSAFTSPPPVRIGLVGALSILPFVLPLSVGAQSPQGKGNPAPSTADPKKDIETGHTLFVKNCSLCHGANGQGGEGPSLQKLTLSDAAIRTTITNGIKAEMPAFGNKFKDPDLKALVAFIHSVKK
jgi:mono/diheme cytochrome c family protein